MKPFGTTTTSQQLTCEAGHLPQPQPDLQPDCPCIPHGKSWDLDVQLPLRGLVDVASALQNLWHGEAFPKASKISKVNGKMMINTVSSSHKI